MTNAIFCDHCGTEKAKKCRGIIVSGPEILLLSTGIVDDARTKGFCQAFEIGRGKLKLVDPGRGGEGGGVGGDRSGHFFPVEG